LTRSTIVVVTWRGKGHVGACLDAVATQTRPHRLVVIDNASDDGTAEILARHPSAPSVRRLPVNAGYAGALAEVAVDTEFTAWLNDDAEPAPDWLARLEEALDQHEEAAAAASRMVGLDGSVISVGVGLTADGHGVDLTSAAAPPFGFCGGAALLRTAALREAGGVPARFFCYYEDTDTAWRLRLTGRTVVSVPDAVVTHRHGASTRPGSRQFHLWNERNRLAMLIRCAPAATAAREVTRFAAITALLPLRRALNQRQPAPVPNPSPAGPELSVPSASVETGGPPARERDFRSGSVGEPVAGGRPRPRNRRWLPVTWKPGGPRTGERDFRSSSVGQPAVPWNFSTGLRLQVLRELLRTLGPLLRERRTISRVANVPRTVVWRRSRSTNSPS